MINIKQREQNPKYAIKLTVGRIQGVTLKKLENCLVRYEIVEQYAENKFQTIDMRDLYYDNFETYSEIVDEIVTPFIKERLNRPSVEAILDYYAEGDYTLSDCCDNPLNIPS